MEYIRTMLPPLLAVAAVVAGAYFTTRWLGTRLGAQAGGARGRIRVIERAAIGRDAQLVAVRAGEKVLLLSVCARSTVFLCELDSGDFPGDIKTPGDGKAGFARAFSDALARRGQTVQAENERSGEE